MIAVFAIAECWLCLRWFWIRGGEVLAPGAVSLIGNGSAYSPLPNKGILASKSKEHSSWFVSLTSGSVSGFVFWEG